MKISGKQLDMVLYKIKYAMLGYSHDDKDFEVEISLTKEDPGNGIMVDCLTLSSTKESGDSSEKSQTTMSVEIYPTSEKLDPIASKTESFAVTKKH